MPRTYDTVATLGRGCLLPDLSLGPYQLKMSTVAADHAIPAGRNGRWLRLSPKDARRIVAECMDEGLAAEHARRRIRNALAFAAAGYLDAFAATALLYAGELPSTWGTPYQKRLRVRFEVRHRACGSRASDFHGGPRNRRCLAFLTRSQAQARDLSSQRG